MQFHCVSAVFAIGAGFFFRLSPSEFAYLLVTILLVLFAECMNTALEISVDLTTKKFKLRAMLSKDIAAGAVLLTCIHGLIAGYLLFFHRLYTLVNGG